MDVFNKFYTRLQPLLEKESANGKIPADSYGVVAGVVHKIILEATEIYARDIMKDKFGLSVDLSGKQIANGKPDENFTCKFRACEICAQARIVHKCHIIPKCYGGPDSSDNYIILCANHHYLFDKGRLSQKEWDKIDWYHKSPEAQEFVQNVMLPRQKMYWEYGSTCRASGCSCGSADFDLRFEEEPGDGRYKIPSLTRYLVCKTCGESYCESFFTGYEFEWWWAFVVEKYKSGELDKLIRQQ